MFPVFIQLHYKFNKNKLNSIGKKLQVNNGQVNSEGIQVTKLK